MVLRKAILIGAIVAVIMVSVDIGLWLLAINGFFNFSLFIYTATIFNLLLVSFTRLAIKNAQKRSTLSTPNS